MTDERISIEIKDQVDSSIEPKINSIAASARNAHIHVQRLQKALAALSGSGGVTRLQAEYARLQGTMARTAVTNQNLITAQQRTATAAAQAAAAQQRVATAMHQTAAASAAAAAAQARATAAQNAAAISAIRLQQAQQRAAQATGRLAGQSRILDEVLPYVGVYTLARAVVYLSDTYTTLSNKLQIASDSQEHNAELLERMFELANKTRTDVSATTVAFTRFDRAMKGLGKSQEDTIRLTETVNKALIVSGATTAEAQSALIQLSQAFNAGRLQGDEFRSLAENMPIVLDYVAKALGRPVEELKKLSTEGKITSAVLIEAFTLMQDAVDEKFSSTVPTISQAFTVLKNNAIQFWGEMDRGAGIGQLIAQTLLLIANNLDRIAFYAIAAGVALAGMWVAGQVAAVAMAAGITRAAAALVILRGAIIRTGIGALVVLAGEVAYQLWEWVDAAGGVGAAMERVGLMATAAWEGMKSTFYYALADMGAALAAFLADVASMFNSVFGTSITAGSSGMFAMSATMNEKGSDAFIAAEEATAKIKALDEAAKKANDSVSKLRGAGGGNGGGAGAGDGGGGGRGRRGGGGRDKELVTLQSIVDEMDKELKLLTLLPKEREVEKSVQDAVNKLKDAGITLSEKELTLLREKTIALQKANEVAQEEASLMEQTVYAREKAITQMQAMNNLLNNPDSGFTTNDALTSLAQTELGAYLDHLPEMVNARIEAMQYMYEQIDALRDADVISERSAAAARVSIWAAEQKARTDKFATFFGGIAELANSGNERMARIGRAAAITQTIINTYQSATAAYASMAGIPVIGPALGAAAAAAAIAAGMANVAQIRAQSTNTGYMRGGYTGDIGRTQVAGAVHGREYVMDAGATSRIGVQNLDALRRGAAMVQRNDASAVQSAASRANGMAATEANTAPVVNIRIINVTDPAMVKDYLESDEGETTFVNMLHRNSDTVQKVSGGGRA